MASANAVPSGGGTVTISGLSFGVDDSTLTASLSLSNACSSTAWTSLTTVSCTPDAYRGAALCVGASLSAVVAGTWSAQFSFDGMNWFAIAESG